MTDVTPPPLRAAEYLIVYTPELGPRLACIVESKRYFVFTFARRRLSVLVVAAAIMSSESVSEIRLIVTPLKGTAKYKLGWFFGPELSHWALVVRERVYEVTTRIDDAGQPRYGNYESDKLEWFAEKARENRKIKKDLLVGHTTVSDDTARRCGKSRRRDHFICFDAELTLRQPTKSGHNSSTTRLASATARGSPGILHRVSVSASEKPQRFWEEDALHTKAYLREVTHG